MIGSFRFADAVDVIEYASLQRLMGWRTWPDIWHLDDAGLMQCASRSTSLDSIRSWARDPSDLLMMRRVGVAETGCALRWLISEPLAAISACEDVDEVDAQRQRLGSPTMDPRSVLEHLS